MKKIFYLILILTIPLLSDAQKWKRYRYEVLFGIGYSNFFGDLGGGNGKGGQSIISVKDVDFGASRPAFFVGARYKVIERFAIKFNLLFTYVSGYDKYSGSISRKNRGESFSSPLFEQSLMAEFSVIKERYGRRYTMGNIRSLKKLHINTYLFFGVGGFWFSPKTKIDGIQIEGQASRSTGESYKTYQLAIPIGIGLKYGVNRKLNIGLEYGNRFTFTDFIDNHKDVSSGNKGKDSYMLLNLIFTYKLRTTRSGLPKF
ncbi:MAG: hypothetical protein A2033_07145 [Bacteroidetes bacterium GWA2_31_9]|nr:MAG: hypothetical protein A2033_07145 [Bacteroidetes bacterium GWA2_31_9]